MLTDQMEAEARHWTRAAAADLPIAVGTRYRVDANTLNDKKNYHLVNQVNVQLNGEARLRFADARQTRKLQHGPLSERLRNADLLTRTVLDGWEGVRQVVNRQTMMQTLQLARQAVRTVRNLLPLAPFNNQPQGRANPYVDLVTSVGHGMQLVEAISEHLVQEEENRIQPQHADFCFRYAATSAAARAVGGGVCSHLMSVTAGVLTMIAPADTDILLWFSHADHQFCVISVAHGPWVIVDPWPQRSVVTTWDNHCYFPPPQGTRADRVQAERAHGQHRTEEENYAKISIRNPCETPYGVPGLLKRAKDLLGQLHGNVQAAAPGHPYQHMDSVDPHSNLQHIPHLAAAAPTEWGHNCA